MGQANATVYPGPLISNVLLSRLHTLRGRASEVMRPYEVMRPDFEEMRLGPVDEERIGPAATPAHSVSFCEERHKAYNKMHEGNGR